MFKMGNGWLIVKSFLAACFLFKKVGKFPHSERDSPEVEEGSTTEISSVSIALIVKDSKKLSYEIEITETKSKSDVT